MNFLCGRILDGKYFVDKPLGVGGMGAVFVAHHLGIGRIVALKVIRPDLLQNANARGRFDREARAAGSLRHSNIVNVTDYGATSLDGQRVAYLVMEYLTGQTLANVLEGSRTLPVPLVLDITSQIADALTVAHAEGIVHRDLKPANIWLTPDARGGFRVTLLDFGIATLRDDVLSSSGLMQRELADTSAPMSPFEVSGGDDVTTAATVASGPDIDLSRADTDARHTTTESPALYPTAANGSFTRAGEIVGTPAYMSPEQCAGSAVDHRSDIYSLAIVVYRMLAGRLPFAGDTLELIRQHTIEPPPDLSRINGSVNVAAANTIARALNKSPGNRFTSAATFAAALHANSLGTTEALRQAIAIFAQRIPELWTLSALIVLPSMVCAVVATLAIVVAPLQGYFAGLLLYAVSVPLTTVTAMAAVTVTFDDLKYRPFARISWRTIAQQIACANGRPTSSLAYFTRPMRIYARCVFRSRGNNMLNMLMFVAQYRGGPQLDEVRIHRMSTTLPKKTFAVMAALQMFCTLVLPIVVGLAVFGLSSLLGADTPRLAVVAAVLSVPATQVLQILVALVDVIMFDLALSATAD
jgi:serine/threonine protein kinase